MSRVIKSIAIALAFTAGSSFISSITNNKYFNIGTVNAYAAGHKLTSLSLESSGGSDINLYENKNYTKKLDEGHLEDTYYAKLSSSKSKVVVNTDSSNGVVKISKSRSSKTYNSGDDILITAGQTTTLYVKVYASEDDAENNKDCQRQYKLILRRYTKEEEKESVEDDQDKIYLEILELDYGDIPLGFRRDKMNYDVKIDNDIKSLKIKAEPEDGSYTVRINGITVKEDNDYSKMINVSNDTTKVEITLTYDEDSNDAEKRTYTINISKKDKSENNNNSETSSETSDSSSQNSANNGSMTENDGASKNETAENNSNNQSSSINSSTGWIKDNGRWKYKDGYGNELKNTWFNDMNTGKVYYFDNDGYMKTGWLPYNNDWYYLNESGDMATGWKQVGSSWYYLDYNGKMETGWLLDSDGRYYYLNNSGEMAVNTVIDGCKVGSNGAWIK